MISNKIAQIAIKASESKAEEIGIAITTVIADNHGTVIAMSRMDEAFVISPDFAFQKAYTSATLGLSTEDMSKYSLPGKPYYGILNVSPGKISIIGGGLPVLAGKKILGGVGVGGASDTSNDVLCAREAVKAIQVALKSHE